MRYFTEYHIKNTKKYWTQWYRAQDNIPQGVHFIQGYSSKNGEVSVAIWQSDSKVQLERYMKEYFSEVASYRTHEMDDYHFEGQPLRWVA